jgi:hypothetical protein
VQRPFAKQQQQRRLDEALDPRLNRPVPRPQKPAASSSGVATVSHARQYR